MHASNSGPVCDGRPTIAGVASTLSLRLFKENADHVKEGDPQTDLWTKQSVKVAKWTVSEAAAARVTGKKLKRVFKSKDVLDGCRRYEDEGTRHNLYESDDD